MRRAGDDDVAVKKEARFFFFIGTHVAFFSC